MRCRPNLSGISSGVSAALLAQKKKEKNETYDETCHVQKPPTKPSNDGGNGIIQKSHMKNIQASNSNVPPLKSCLFAKIRIMASFISRSPIILCNSRRASSIRSLSAQSTTKIRPCVPV